MPDQTKGRDGGATSDSRSADEALDRRDRSLSIDGLRLRVVTVGSGMPLLLLNGIGANLDMWGPLADQFDGRRLILFDAPGTGLSSTPWIPRTMAGSADIVARMLDELGETRVDVLGLSYGGALAQEFARRHTKRVRRLVLAATTFGIGAIPGKASFLLASPARYYSERLFHSLAPHLYGGRMRARPDLLRRHADARLSAPPTPRGYWYQVMSIAMWSSLPWLARLDVETLVLAGDRDPVCPLLNARIVARLLPRAELEVIAGGGHLFLMDDAENVVPIVMRFLDRDRQNDTQVHPDRGRPPRKGAAA